MVLKQSENSLKKSYEIFPETYCCTEFSEDLISTSLERSLSKSLSLKSIETSLPKQQPPKNLNILKLNAPGLNNSTRQFVSTADDLTYRVKNGFLVVFNCVNFIGSCIPRYEAHNDVLEFIAFFKDNNFISLFIYFCKCFLCFA